MSLLFSLIAHLLVTLARLAKPDCKEAEAAKIERFLGISRDSGMSDAIKWANSDDPNTRELAAEVLEDSGTPDAVEYLRTLSNDGLLRAFQGFANQTPNSLLAFLNSALSV